MEKISRKRRTKSDAPPPGAALMSAQDRGGELVPR